MLTFNNNKKLQAGFTLLEVMIAIVVLSFIVIAIVQITGGAQEKVDRTLKEDKEILQIETAFSRFEWDFSQVYSPLYHSHETRIEEDSSDESKQATQQVLEAYNLKPNFDQISFEGIPIPKFSIKDKNELIFFTSSNRRKLKNIKQSHFAWVRYELITDRTVEEGDNIAEGEAKKVRTKKIWVRKLKTNDVFNNESIDWSKIKSQVLLRNVESIKYEFWDPEQRKWFDNLRSINNGERIFRGIRITLKWLDPYENEQFFIRTFRPLFPYFKPEDMYELERAQLTEDNPTTTEEAENEN